MYTQFVYKLSKTNQKFLKKIVKTGMCDHWSGNLSKTFTRNFINNCAKKNGEKISKKHLYTLVECFNFYLEI